VDPWGTSHVGALTTWSVTPTAVRGWGVPLVAREPGTAFMARFSGKCRGCHLKYGPGMVIVSPGKGAGAFHKKCWERHGLESRPATTEDIERIRDLKRRHRSARPLGGDYA
jgi:hypothetical protein